MDYNKRDWEMRNETFALDISGIILEKAKRELLNHLTCSNKNYFVKKLKAARQDFNKDLKNYFTKLKKRGF